MTSPATPLARPPTPPTRSSRHRPRGWLRARLWLGSVVAVLAVATVVGLVALWPTGRGAAPPPLVVAGGSFQHARVLSLTTATCPVGGDSGSAASGTAVCGSAVVELTDGVDTGKRVTVDVPPESVGAGLGSEVVLVRTPGGQGASATGGATYSMQDVERGTPLWVLAAVFLVVVLLVARWRGLFALLGLAVAGAVLALFVLPGLLEGRQPVLVGVVGASAIVLVVLYLAHGISVRTTTALLGTYAGLAVTTVAGVVAVRATHLTGVSSDEGSLLQSLSGQLQPRDLLTCAIILAGLGVLNDVTIAQTSSVWELREAAPDIGRAELFARGMRIGRDHIASTIYTIVFAYAGAALPVLLLLALYDQSLASVVTSNDIAEEVVRTLASAIGLVLAVPLTTGLAVVVARSPGVVVRGVVAQSGDGTALPPG